MPGLHPAIIEEPYSYHPSTSQATEVSQFSLLATLFLTTSLQSFIGSPCNIYMAFSSQQCPLPTILPNLAASFEFIFAIAFQQPHLSKYCSDLITCSTSFLASMCLFPCLLSLRTSFLAATVVAQ